MHDVLHPVPDPTAVTETDRLKLMVLVGQALGSIEGLPFPARGLAACGAVATLIRDDEGLRRAWYEFGGFGPMPERTPPYVGAWRTFHPQPGRVLIRWEGLPEKTKSGFYLPNTSAESKVPRCVGLVLAHGGPVPGDPPRDYPSVGDRIAYEQHGDWGFQDGDETLVLVPIDTVLGVILAERAR